MALAQQIFDILSLRSVIVVAVVAAALYLVADTVDRRVRLSRLPAGQAKQVPSKLPFGLSIYFRLLRSAQQNTSYECWVKYILGPCGPETTTVNAHILGRTLVMTVDPENIKAVLATQFHDFGKGEDFHQRWQPLLGDSIFATDGEKWHDSRQLLRPQFVRDRISDLDNFEAHMKTLLQCIAKGGPLDGAEKLGRDKLEAGYHVVSDMADLFYRYTLDVTTEFLLAHDVQSMCTVNHPFAKAFNEAQRLQNEIEFAVPFHNLMPRAVYKTHLATINAHINPHIERALRLSPEELERHSKSEGHHSYTFLHALAARTRDRRILRDQILAVLLAGRDTTACTLSWTIYELACRPDIVSRLRRDIVAVLGPGTERLPTYADIKAMKSLQHAINETLRMYPIVPFNVRCALRDTTLPRGGGPDGSAPVAVLKGMPVVYSTLVMQRRRDLYPTENGAASVPYRGKEEDSHNHTHTRHPSNTPPFPDPDIYEPERWQHWQPPPWTYIPFNGGPRICIGQQFALTEVAYVLCRLLQHFDRIDLLDAHGVPASLSGDGGGDGGLDSRGQNAKTTLHPGMQTDLVLSPLRRIAVRFRRVRVGHE